MQQTSLFEEEQSSRPKHYIQPQPAMPSPELLELGQALPGHLYLGTSSWSTPGWKGSVYAEQYDEKTLSREGLSAYAKHPLLKCVSIDRSFYAPLSQQDYEQYAQQVPDHFRFVVKAPSSLLSPVLYRKKEVNPDYLNPDKADAMYFQPLQGLGEKLGWALLQVPPLPEPDIKQPKRFYEGLSTLLERAKAYALPVMVEVRDRTLLTHELVDRLIAHQARLCLSLHPRLPALPTQYRIQAAFPAGPLFIRWNLNRQLNYNSATEVYAPYDQRLEPDEEAQMIMASYIKHYLEQKKEVWVLANNKAEGSAPLTLEALAKKIIMVNPQ